jgi:hypothetical protein
MRLDNLGQGASGSMLDTQDFGNQRGLAWRRQVLQLQLGHIWLIAPPR